MSAHHDNPRNALENFLREIGLRAEDHCTLTCEPVEGGFAAHVCVTLPTGEEVTASGDAAPRKKPSQMAACQALLDQLAQTHPQYFVDAATLQVDAQRGDALIKLAGYLVDPTASAADASRWLQTAESNARLADLFDLWRQAGDTDLLQWGTHLSDHRKGTLVEALIWRRFGPRVVTPDAVTHLAALRRVLTTA